MACTNTSRTLAPYIRLFEATARTHAALPAAEDRDGCASYAQLDGMANRFAAELRRSGVERGAFVAIACERGVLTLAAILALFKLGAAYVPLDPLLPLARRQRMLASSGCARVLVEADGGDLRADCPVVDLKQWAALGPLWDESFTGGGAEDPAYVIFTSGSSGEPKGAVLSQANLLNHLWAKVEDLGLNHDDRIAQTAPFGFDLSVWQFLAAGLVGACVTVMDRETVAYPPSLLEAMVNRSVTVFQAVPSYLSVFVDAVSRRPGGMGEGLRVAVTAGETLPVALVRRWFDCCEVPLMNAYGPTECGVDVTHHLMRRAPLGDSVPIGKAIPGAVLHIVDADLECVPEGESGELLIGGVATGMGYINAPAATAAAFVELPALGGRFYRSGDRVRCRAGVHEYLGRLDLQIKLRGHRIEPEEIEVALLREAGVRAAAVVLHQEGARAELVALVQPEEQGMNVELAGYLRQRLSATLPSYMVPNFIEFVYEMPRNARGKTDRRGVEQLLGMLKPFEV
ncbi:MULTISPECIES: amino acid adenylation domain-containing protein [Pseudomonas]|uniref:Peptide synthetase n=1 Tax=Pseudomonas fluorescens TaxID=294 RepID=A0A0N9X4P0_PSEFL|nr:MULTISPECIES: amino acid adenylation domain-containing protein [Pseudomonas]ALI10218.1 peptide synthetase [Pseudomonas fluorescens]